MAVGYKLVQSKKTFLSGAGSRHSYLKLFYDLANVSATA
jgi:hypothetical protein